MCSSDLKAVYGFQAEARSFIDRVYSPSPGPIVSTPAGPRHSARASARLVNARSHIEKLLADVPSLCGIVSVLDGQAATLAWLGAVHGHRVRPLGAEHFGQTGSIPDLTGTTGSTPMLSSRRPLR